MIKFIVAFSVINSRFRPEIPRFFGKIVRFHDLAAYRIDKRGGCGFSLHIALSVFFLEEHVFHFQCLGCCCQSFCYRCLSGQLLFSGLVSIIIEFSRQGVQYFIYLGFISHGNSAIIRNYCNP